MNFLAKKYYDQCLSIPNYFKLSKKDQRYNKLNQILEK